MGSLIILILIVVLFLWGLKEYYEMKLGISPEASPRQVANELISLCKDIDSSGNFLDVGSGWGSMLIPMAQALPDWTFYGIEKSPTPWFVSQFKTMRNNFGNVNLFLGDAEKFRYRGYDIIYLNVPKKLINEITPALLRNIDRGSLVVTYRNKIDGIEAFNSINLKDPRGVERQVHLYANVNLGAKPDESDTQQEVSSDKSSDTEMHESNVQSTQSETKIPEPSEEIPLELEDNPLDKNPVETPEK